MQVLMKNKEDTEKPMFQRSRVQEQMDSFLCAMDRDLSLEDNLNNALLDRSYYRWSLEDYKNLCYKIEEAYKRESKWKMA